MSPPRAVRPRFRPRFSSPPPIFAPELDDGCRLAGLRSPSSDVTLDVPMDEQEIWAAGVTYLRSRDARMEESTEESVYDRVYDAERPEIFFKATRNRVSRHRQPVAHPRRFLMGCARTRARAR